LRRRSALRDYLDAPPHDGIGKARTSWSTTSRHPAIVATTSPRRANRVGDHGGRTGRRACGRRGRKGRMVVLLNMLCPAAVGYDVLAELGEGPPPPPRREETKRTWGPGMLITARKRRADRNQGLSLGADDISQAVSPKEIGLGRRDGARRRWSRAGRGGRRLVTRDDRPGRSDTGERGQRRRSSSRRPSFQLLRTPI